MSLYLATLLWTLLLSSLPEQLLVAPLLRTPSLLSLLVSLLALLQLVPQVQ
jgi:hypothetical protein